MARSKPVTYRNVSDSDKSVYVQGRYQLVKVGEQIEAGDTGTYWQTGEQGEEAIWEVVGVAPSSSSPDAAGDVKTQSVTNESKES